MPQEEDFLIASSIYIDSLKRIASEAEKLARLEGYWDETSAALLNFPWLCKKFELFWFENPESEATLGLNLPSDSFFSPLDFERLVQSVLLITQDRFYRETPTTGDGGIDLIFKDCVDSNWGAYETTLVQCKLYRSHVPISDVRDFFGVISANTASGLFITTGRFTSQARTFLPMANKSPHSNSLYALDGTSWSYLLEIAKECHFIMGCAACEEDSNAIDEFVKELEVLRNRAMELICRESVMANQESLF